MGNDPTLSFDSVWVGKTLIAILTIRAAGGRLRGLEPPSRFAEMHGKLLIMAAHYDRAMDLYADGVDNLDTSLLIESSVEINFATEAMSEARAMLDIIMQ